MPSLPKLNQFDVLSKIVMLAPAPTTLLKSETNKVAQPNLILTPLLENDSPAIKHCDGDRPLGPTQCIDTLH